jgi:hypothetical protein
MALFDQQQITGNKILYAATYGPGGEIALGRQRRYAGPTDALVIGGIRQGHQNQLRHRLEHLAPRPVHCGNTHALRALASCFVGRPRRRGFGSCSGSATVIVNRSNQACTAWLGHNRLRQPGG